MRNDKLILWGAWAAMAAAVTFSILRTSDVPMVDPAVTKIGEEMTAHPNEHRFPAPPPVPVVKTDDINIVIPEPKPVTVFAGHVRTKLVGIPIVHKPIPVSVLSLPVPVAAKSTLDVTLLTWTLIEPKVELKYWMTPRTEAKPAGYIIKRQAEDEEQPREIGRADAKATSYTDLTAKPRMTYRYWVEATGKESNLTLDPPPLEVVTKGTAETVKTRTPANTRMKLIGGDKANAFLRAETYDRATKKWIGKTEMTVPGKAIGTSGWTLNGLRFDNFTLVADVTDDEGVARVLSTKD